MSKNFQSTHTEKDLRSKHNYDFVDWLAATSIEKTFERIGEPTECPCIKMLVMERFTVDELKGIIKFGSMLAQFFVYNLEHSCPVHDSEEELVMEQNNAAFLFSAVEHAQVELNRREKEFEFKSE